MAEQPKRIVTTAIRPYVDLSADGKWLNCRFCQGVAYWGAFRPDEFIVAKASKHVERKHAAKADGEAEADASAHARRNGPVHVLDTHQRARHAAATDLLADALKDLHDELNPARQGGQGPRMFAEQGGAKPRRAARRVPVHHGRLTADLDSMSDLRVA
jgi:hypothetical protein